MIDFSVIKSQLCDWLERNWDHKMLLWKDDYILDQLLPCSSIVFDSIVIVPFNPTAENMAKYLVEEVGPRQLEGTDVELIKVTIDETRKCSATYEVNL